MRRRRIFATVMALAVCFVLSALSPSRVDAIVDELLFIKSVTGTYFLSQQDENNFKRIVTITADYCFFSVSQESPSFGFSDGQGAWQRIGLQQKIRARILDFDFDLETGAPLSVSRATFTIMFAVKVNGKFQAVSGEFLVEQFELNKNPLDPKAEPFQTFGPTGFTGHRVTVD